MDTVKLDTIMKVRVPNTLKARYAKLARRMSLPHEKAVAAADLMREALREYADRAEQTKKAA